MPPLIKKILPPIVPFFIVVGLLELLTRTEMISTFILPAPTQIFGSFINDTQELATAALSSILCSVAGLLISFILGFAIAAVLAISKPLKRALYPYAVFFQTVPIIAIAPVMVIWFGFGQPTAIASAVICSVFPIIASTLLGLESTDPALLDLFKLYSADQKHTLWKLRIPFALPQIFSGLRIAAGLSIIGCIVGEFIGGGGLGSVIDAARTQQRLDKVFAAVLVSSLIGLILISLINTLSYVSLRHWHASEKSA